MTKKTLLVILMLLSAVSINAQVVSSLAFETRVDTQASFLAGEYNPNASGFAGKFLNFKMAGNLSDQLSYSFRQRINKPQENGSMFDATDWVYLTYSTGKWNISAGKQVVAIGGYEYDRAPIDVYFASEYWNNIACYQFGVSGGYALSENDNLSLQVCQSPFGSRADNLYAYNLMWCGSHGAWRTIYTFNFMQTGPDKMINYIALGNRFDLGGAVVELDFMNRTPVDDISLMKNFSIMADMKCSLGEKLDVFGKVTYDQNTTSHITDSCVMPGSKLTTVGAGVECYPFGGRRDVRIHAAANYVMGESIASAIVPDSFAFTMGLTWRLDLLSGRK